MLGAKSCEEHLSLSLCKIGCYHLFHSNWTHFKPNRKFQTGIIVQVSSNNLFPASFCSDYETKTNIADLESNFDNNLVTLKNMGCEYFTIAQSSFLLLLVIFVRLETKRNPLQGTPTPFKTLEKSIYY